MNDDNKFGEETPAEHVEPSAQASAVRTPPEETKPEPRNLPDLLYGVLAKPVETLRYLTMSKPLTMALLVYIAISVLGAIAAIPGLAQLDSLPGGVSRDVPPGLSFFSSPAFIIATVISTPIFALITLFIVGGLYHLLSMLFKGEGDFRGLLSALGFASFPQVLSIPFVLLSLVAGTLGGVLSGVVSFAVSIWIIVLTIISIRENYRLSTGKAVLIFFIPLIAFLALIAVFIGFLVAVFVGTMSGGGRAF